MQFSAKLRQLSGPILRDAAILPLQYPVSQYLFKEVGTPPRWCDTLHLVLSFAQAHLCDTPFATHCTITVRYPIKNEKHERVLRYYRYKYSAI